jgi:hypothetical protein
MLMLKLWGKRCAASLEEAARYYQLAAEQGNSDAQDSDGWCLENGKGVKSDLNEAVHSFKLSADQGDGIPQWWQGMSLSEQTFDSHCSSDAVHLFRLAADQEQGRGEFHYALCCPPDSSDRKHYMQCSTHGFLMTNKKKKKNMNKSSFPSHSIYPAPST